MRAWAILIVIGAFAASNTWSYFKGRGDGKFAEQLEQLEKINELNDQLDAKKAELTALEAERLRQTRELEDRVTQLQEEAREDANATRPALGAASMRRLNAVTAGD